MRYMLLVYSKEQASAYPESMQQIAETHRRVMAEASQKGILEGAEPLRPTTTATTVRPQHGKSIVLDGPFAETKEQLAGYYILNCKDLDEAINIENSSEYGNAASVFTQSGSIARQVMERASAGMIGVNVGVPVPREPFSFGGWNESKFGVCDITGQSSIEFWTKLKKSTTKWNPEAGVNWMS